MVIRPMRSGDEQPVTKYRPMSALSRFVPDPWSEIIGRGRTIGRNKPGAWGENARGAAGQARLWGCFRTFSGGEKPSRN